VKTFSVHVKILTRKANWVFRIDVLKRKDVIDFQTHKFYDLCVQALHKCNKLRTTAQK